MINEQINRTWGNASNNELMNRKTKNNFSGLHERKNSLQLAMEH